MSSEKCKWGAMEPPQHHPEQKGGELFRAQCGTACGHGMCVYPAPRHLPLTDALQLIHCTCACVDLYDDVHSSFICNSKNLETTQSVALNPLNLFSLHTEVSETPRWDPLPRQGLTLLAPGQSNGLPVELTTPHRSGWALKVEHRAIREPVLWFEKWWST